MGTGEFNAGDNPAMDSLDWHPIQGGVEVLLVASCFKTGDNYKRPPDGPSKLVTDFTYRGHRPFLPLISPIVCGLSLSRSNLQSRRISNRSLAKR